MSWSPYLEDINISSRRLLTMLNKNSFEKSTGSFDRSFWHFKTKDYSSSIYQMGIGILAKLWKLQGSSYYQSPLLIDWIEGGIFFLKKIQKRDGSFDEWYVNERGWAGPTGYLINSCLDTYEILSEQLSTKAKTDLILIIKRGIDFLTKSTEGHVLSNHIAIVVLPLIQAKHLLGMNLSESIDKLLVSFEKYWIDSEGWSLEYDGADPGYQSGTLSFLAKCLKYENNSKIRNYCIRSLEFIQYFAYPSGSVGGAVGSRHTVTLFPAGIEFFRGSDLGARLSLFLEQSIEQKQVVLSSDLDDHYLVYRLFEFLDAHDFYINNKVSNNISLLPFEKKSFEKMFHKAGIRVGKTNNSYWVISYRRGGAIRVEDINKKTLVLIDNGINLKVNKKKYSSLWQDIAALDGDKVSGHLVEVTPKTFTPFKLILFRLILICFGWHYKTSLMLKDTIRKMLIFNKASQRYPFSRSIVVENDKIMITTEVLIKKKSIVSIGGEFWTRYVPQSRHFLIEHLTSICPYYEKETSKNVIVTKEVIL